MSGKMTKKGRNPGMVDNWLDNLDLYRKNVAYDETCLFRAISEQLFHSQVFHERVRRECINYGKKHFEEFQHLIHDDQVWYQHLDMLEKHMVICGNLEIQLVSRNYGRDVLIFHANQQQIYDVTKLGLPSQPLMLCLMDKDHYDAVYRKEQICNAGFCQSLVYKILYEKVFKIADVDNIVNAMLYEKTTVINEVELEDKSDLKPEDLVNAVIAPFPFKVAKALDPTIYRNIEYDSWGEVRRELRLGDWYYGDDKLKLGTRCLLLDAPSGETLDCFIQELYKDQDKCIVYLTKTAEKRVVKYSDLAPESDAKPWPLPYRFSKNLVINNTTQLAPMEKVKNMRKKNKEKRQQSKSVNDLSNVTNDGIDGVSAFVGVPLQMHNHTNNNNECIKVEAVTETVGLTLPPSEGLITPVTPDINNYPQRYQWEQVNWPTQIQYVTPDNTYYPPSPEQLVWSQGSSAPYYEYKPMVASAPVTPNVVPYHDTSYPYYVNYHVEQYPQYPPTPTTPISAQTILQRPAENMDNSHQQQVVNPQVVQNEIGNCQVTPTGGATIHRQNVPYMTHTPQTIDVYPQMVNIPPGTSVVYTTVSAQDGIEMVVPTSPLPMYTPTTPVDLPYVTQAGYMYSPGQVPTVPWYPPAGGFPYNQQGFVFPPPNPQAK